MTTESAGRKAYEAWVLKNQPEADWLGGDWSDLQCRMYAPWNEQTPEIRAAWIERTTRKATA
jgi:hypothetical protein